jgi:hypothetical protein
VRHVVDATDYALEPAHIYCDFENGLLRALTDHFPTVPKIGCLFHFKQACRRRMKMCCIPNAECTIALTPGIFDMLTVLPRHKVRRHGVKWVQLKIKSNCAAKCLPFSHRKWSQFWAYFDRTWCVKFPPDYWNIQPYSAQIISRTNNPRERFNRELNAAFASPHPNLPTFVSTIEKVARSHAALRYDQENGHSGIGAPDRRQLISIPRAV